MVRLELLLLLLQLVCRSHQKEIIKGAATVTDGDTIKIAGVSIRFHGIDAPETKQPCWNVDGSQYSCGLVAKKKLADAIGSRITTCTVTTTDRYGRKVAVCRVRRTTTSVNNLNAWMVSKGYAAAYKEYSTDYVAKQTAAIAAKRGFWSGTFQYPPDWRRGVAFPTPSSPPPPPPATAGCLIKGNISSSGKVYHVPGGRYYAQTIIDESKGERWFCSEEEAVEAGWRKSSF
jgi:endonuclease YncB( thermonuclease family)